MTLTKSFLLTLGTRVGDNLVVYDVAGRKVYFLYHNNNGFRFKQIRGKRRSPIRIRPKDKLIRINADGTVERNNLTGFIVPEEQ